MLSDTLTEEELSLLEEDEVEEKEIMFYAFSEKIKGITLYRRGLIKEIDSEVEKYIDPVIDCNVETRFIDVTLLNQIDLKYLLYFDPLIRGLVIHY